MTTFPASSALASDGSHPSETLSGGTASVSGLKKSVGRWDPPHGALDSAAGRAGGGGRQGQSSGKKEGAEKRQRVEARTKVLEVSWEVGEGERMGQKHRPQHPDRSPDGHLNQMESIPKPSEASPLSFQ